MQLELSQEEQEFLLNLLEQSYQELRGEVRKTESHEFKETLRSKEHLMEGLLQRLSRRMHTTTA